jgi:hypothetical protein
VTHNTCPKNIVTFGTKSIPFETVLNFLSLSEDTSYKKLLPLHAEMEHDGDMFIIAYIIKYAFTRQLLHLLATSANKDKLFHLNDPCIFFRAIGLCGNRSCIAVFP